MLEKIKTLLSITDNSKDALLSILVEDATQYVKDYTHQDTLPIALESAVRDLVILNYNRQGTEGVTSESFSGVSQSYLDDLPKPLLKKLKSYRRLPR